MYPLKKFMHLIVYHAGKLTNTVLDSQVLLTFKMRHHEHLSITELICPTRKDN